MAQGLEEINRKIATQCELLELAEEETERLITRSKTTEKDEHFHFQHVELKFEKFLEFQCKKFYWTQVRWNT